MSSGENEIIVNDLGPTETEFWAAILGFSGVLMGFVFLLLSWRIQREATFTADLRHLPISTFLSVGALLVLAFLGVVPALVYLSGNSILPMDVSVGGMTSALVLLIGHLATEAIHYELLTPLGLRSGPVVVDNEVRVTKMTLAATKVTVALAILSFIGMVMLI